MQEPAQELNSLVSEGYIPSSVERKKAVLMYFFVGILVGISQKKVTVYEVYHLKQAIGWWIVFFILLVLFSFLFRVPFIRILPILIFLALVVVWGMFIKQAWEGYYSVGNDKILFPFFSGLGGWVLDVFEIEVEKEEIEDQENQKKDEKIQSSDDNEKKEEFSADEQEEKKVGE